MLMHEGYVVEIFEPQRRAARERPQRKLKILKSDEMMLIERVVEKEGATKCGASNKQVRCGAVRLARIASQVPALAGEPQTIDEAILVNVEDSGKNPSTSCAYATAELISATPPSVLSMASLSTKKIHSAEHSRQSRFLPAAIPRFLPDVTKRTFGR